MPDESVNFQACEIKFGVAVGSEGTVWGHPHGLGTIEMDFEASVMDRNGEGPIGMDWDQYIQADSDLYDDLPTSLLTY